FQYAVDFDLDGQADLGSTTKIEGEPYAPIGRVVQFFHRGTGRGDQFRGDFQKLYDEGIQIALKHLGEYALFETHASGRVLQAGRAPSRAVCLRCLTSIRCRGSDKSHVCHAGTFVSRHSQTAGMTRARRWARTSIL